MSEQQHEEQVATIPFYVHEIEMTRANSIIKRLTWTCIVGWAVTIITVIASFLW